ncbi:MAG: type IV pilus modification protein PilV [Casimicrobium sp.]
MNIRKNDGFSLLEVLITIVIVAIGVLGVAGMQVTSIKLADLAQTRTTGTILANDIVERIRANRDNVATYATTFGGGIPAATTTLADRDLRAWKQMLADPIRGVPEGDGRIVVDEDPDCTAGCTLVTVTVRWNEARQRGGKALQEFVIRTRV